MNIAAGSRPRAKVASSSSRCATLSSFSCGMFPSSRCRWAAGACAGACSYFRKNPSTRRNKVAGTGADRGGEASHAPAAIRGTGLAGLRRSEASGEAGAGGGAMCHRRQAGARQRLRVPLLARGLGDGPGLARGVAVQRGFHPVQQAAQRGTLLRVEGRHRDAVQRTQGLRGTLHPRGGAFRDARRQRRGVFDPAVAAQLVEHGFRLRRFNGHRTRQRQAALEGTLADGPQQQPLGIVKARGAQGLVQRTLPGGDCVNQGKDNRLAGFEGSWLHEWRLLLCFAATAMHRHPQGCKGPEHGRPGRHGRRSLWGGLGRPNGETNRIFCQICDNCGNVLSRTRAIVAAAARTVHEV
ncbi:exported protein of unknown function [Cupriavidus taiwanensis]|nr:exported protein of unknown function [Cupriavidus taiwanensis]